MQEVGQAEIMHAKMLWCYWSKETKLGTVMGLGGGGKVYFCRMGRGNVSSRSCIAAFLLILRDLWKDKHLTIVAYDFFLLSFASFHRELFWKPRAYQIYAKRSSNCELMLGHEKKSSFFHHCLNSSYAREKRDHSPPKIPPHQNVPVHCFVHLLFIAFLTSPCPCLVPFLSVQCCNLHLQLSCSEFRRRIPLQCENAIIQCNLPQRTRIRTRLICQGAKTELQIFYEQPHPTSTTSLCVFDKTLIECTFI